MARIDMKKAVPMKKYKLENGLVLVVMPRDTAPVVCINLAYRTGSSDEREGLTGFAHLFEHLMFEGSRHVPKGEFDKLCSMAGGTNNAYTTYDYTSYNMTLPASQLELGLWLESDRMFYFDIVPEALKNQQSVVVEEINQTVENMPYGRWHEMLAKSAFSSGSSYSWAVHGKKEDVASCTLKNAKDFFSNFYRPENAVLALTGDIEPDQAYEKVKKYFGEKTRSNGDISRRIKYIPSHKKSNVHTSFEDNVPHEAVFTAYHCPGFKDDSINTAHILGGILGSGRSSRLYRSLVYESQKASQIGAFVDQREETSLLTLFAIAGDDSIGADELSSMINAQVNDLLENGISEKELEKSRNMLESSTANELQYSSGIADSAAFETLFHGEPERIWQYLERFEAVKIKDAQNFTEEYLTPENFVRVDVKTKK